MQREKERESKERRRHAEGEDKEREKERKRRERKNSLGKKEERSKSGLLEIEIGVNDMTMSFGNIRGKVVQKPCMNTEFGVLMYL